MQSRYFEIKEGTHNIFCKLFSGDVKLAKRAIVFGHGFAGHKDGKAMEKFAERVISKHKDVLLVSFDWPCHGNDVKKKISLDDCDSYLTIVTEYVKKRYGIDDVCYYGNSFGGFVILRYIQKNGNPFRKIALRSPAINMYESFTNTIMTEDAREKLEKGKDALVGFDKKVTVCPRFVEEIKESDLSSFDYLDFAEDIMIVHGDADEIVPFEVSRDFADNNLIEFTAIEGGDHRLGNPLRMEVATKAVLGFLGL